MPKQRRTRPFFHIVPIIIRDKYMGENKYTIRLLWFLGSHPSKFQFASEEFSSVVRKRLDHWMSWYLLLLLFFFYYSQILINIFFFKMDETLKRNIRGKIWIWSGRVGGIQRWNSRLKCSIPNPLSPSLTKK